MITWMPTVRSGSNHDAQYSTTAAPEISLLSSFLRSHHRGTRPSAASIEDRPWYRDLNIFKWLALDNHLPIFPLEQLSAYYIHF
jgi:hypothetical protein